MLKWFKKMNERSKRSHLEQCKKRREFTEELARLMAEDKSIAAVMERKFGSEVGFYLRHAETGADEIRSEKIKKDFVFTPLTKEQRRLHDENNLEYDYGSATNEFVEELANDLLHGNDICRKLDEKFPGGSGCGAFYHKYWVDSRIMAWDRAEQIHAARQTKGG